MPTFEERAMCRITSLHYDAIKQEGVLRCPASNYPNRSAVIDAFEYINPDVRLITIFVADILDVIHVKSGHRWETWPAQTKRSRRSSASRDAEGRGRDELTATEANTIRNVLAAVFPLANPEADTCVDAMA